MRRSVEGYITVVSPVTDIMSVLSNGGPDNRPIRDVKL